MGASHHQPTPDPGEQHTERQVDAACAGPPWRVEVIEQADTRRIETIEDERRRTQPLQCDEEGEIVRPYPEPHTRYRKESACRETCHALIGDLCSLGQCLPQHRSVVRQVEHQRTQKQQQHDHDLQGVEPERPPPQCAWLGVAEQVQQGSEQRIDDEDIPVEQESGVEKTEQQQTEHAARMTRSDAGLLRFGGALLSTETIAEHQCEQRI